MDLVGPDFLPFSWENNRAEVSQQGETNELRFGPGRHSFIVSVINLETYQLYCRVDNALSFVMGHHIAGNCELFQSTNWHLKSSYFRL